MNDTSALPATIRYGSSDHRAELVAALRLVEATIGRLPAHALHAPTPCTGLDVAQIIGHLLFVGQRLEALYTGQPDDPFDAWAPLDLAPAEAAERVAAQFGRVESLLADPAILDRTIMPWRPMSIRESLPMYVSELIVHAWDLATATGIALDAPGDLVALAQEAMEFEIPAEMRAAIFADVVAAGFDPPFGEARPAPATATPIERLAAYVGREVAAR